MSPGGPEKAFIDEQAVQRVAPKEKTRALCPSGSIRVYCDRERQRPLALPIAAVISPTTTSACNKCGYDDE